MPLPKTRVVNIRREACDVYVGRVGLGSDGRFGNPYRIGKNGTREEVLEKFRKYFYNRIATDDKFHLEVLQLKGLRLGCFCAPRPCHADVLAAYLDGPKTSAFSAG